MDDEEFIYENSAEACNKKYLQNGAALKYESCGYERAEAAVALAVALAAAAAAAVVAVAATR